MQQSAMKQHVYDFGIAVITILHTYQEVEFSVNKLVNILNKAVIQTVPFRYNSGNVEIEWQDIDADGYNTLMRTWVDDLIAAHTFPADAQKLLRAAASNPKIAMDLSEKMAKLRVEVETQAGLEPTG